MSESKKFIPYVSPDTSMAEFTVKALLIGLIMAVVLGAANAYLGLKAGMTIALEPMVLVGTYRTRVLPDQWTVASADGSLCAHWEHSVAVTQDEPLILTLL